MDLRGLLEFFAITWTAIEGTTDDVERIEKEQTKLLDQIEEKLAQQIHDRQEGNDEEKTLG